MFAGIVRDSIAARGSAYHMAVDANAANAGRAPIVIEPPSRAHVDGGSDLSASPVRPVSGGGAAPLRLDQDIAGGVMARRQSPSSAGDGPSLPAPRHVEEAALSEAVASLAALDLAGLRVQWRNVFRGVELASAMGARGKRSRANKIGRPRRRCSSRGSQNPRRHQDAEPGWTGDHRLLRLAGYRIPPARRSLAFANVGMPSNDRGAETAGPPPTA